MSFNWIQSCRNLPEYLVAVKREYAPTVKYPTAVDYQKAAFHALVAHYLNSMSVGIRKLRKSRSYFVDFIGFNTQNQPSTVLSLFSTTDTVDEEALTNFVRTSKTVFQLCEDNTDKGCPRMFVVTNKSVTKLLKVELPINQIKFISGTELANNIKNCPNFWTTFTTIPEPELEND